MTVNVFNSLLG